MSWVTPGTPPRLPSRAFSRKAKREPGVCVEVDAVLPHWEAMRTPRRLRGHGTAAVGLAGGPERVTWRVSRSVSPRPPAGSSDPLSVKKRPIRGVPAGWETAGGCGCSGREHRDTRSAWERSSAACEGDTHRTGHTPSGLGTRDAVRAGSHGPGAVSGVREESLVAGRLPRREWRVCVDMQRKHSGEFLSKIKLLVSQRRSVGFGISVS